MKSEVLVILKPFPFGVVIYYIYFNNMTPTLFHSNNHVQTLHKNSL